MSAWELASAAEVAECRVLLERLRVLGGEVPHRADQLEGLTKKRAADVRERLRSAVRVEEARASQLKMTELERGRTGFGSVWGEGGGG